MAKIQTQQQVALQQGQATDTRTANQTLQVSVPFFANGAWQNIDLELNKLSTDADASGKSEAEEKAQKIWQVRLNFATPVWGKIATQLILRGENLRADLWVEDAQKQSKMQLESETLAARLRRIGADVDVITCHVGSMQNKKTQLADGQLIDMHV